MLVLADSWWPHCDVTRLVVDGLLGFLASPNGRKFLLTMINVHILTDRKKHIIYGLTWIEMRKLIFSIKQSVKHDNQYKAIDQINLYIQVSLVNANHT